MGFGEVAAMIMLNNEANRESHNAASLRASYNELAGRFNVLREENIGLRQEKYDLINEYNELLKQSKERLKMINEYDVDLYKAYDQRNAYKNELDTLKEKMASLEGVSAEVVSLKKKIASVEAYEISRNKWMAGAKDHMEKQKLALISKNQKIEDLTGQNSYLKDELVKKENQVNQKGYVLEAIRRGMNEIPGEYRVKAAAKGYVRSPEISQATLDEQMPEKMKEDIEMYMHIALFPEAGGKHFEILDQYEKAKAEIREELAASRKIFEELIAIRANMVQQARDKGEDPSKVPNIWKIQADMKTKVESEATSSTQQGDESEEESYGPRHR